MTDKDQAGIQMRGEDTVITDVLVGMDTTAYGANAEVLRAHLLRLRETVMGDQARLCLLDRLYVHSEEVLATVWPVLWEVQLPLSRRARVPLRAVQEMLECLAHDYIAVLSRVFDPESGWAADTVPDPLWRSARVLSRHLQISYLIASPPEVGIWQMLHSTYATAMRLGLEGFCSAGETQSVALLYLNSVLLGSSQPASFTSVELAFFVAYVSQSLPVLHLVETPPAGMLAVFWIDPARDVAAYPLARRAPPPETTVLYFACDPLAQAARRHLAALEGGLMASELGLPPFAATLAGHGVLRRLAKLWGNPVKRRFTRRRRSYRAVLCAGFKQVWDLIQAPEKSLLAASEWMIINESPEGYAMMHMAGSVDGLAVGDIVGIRPDERESAAWQVCIVRWALSDNPEHIELGLQLLPPGAQAAVLPLPGRQGGVSPAVLLLPKMPPVENEKSMVALAGTLRCTTDQLTAVIQGEQVVVRELRTARLDEQTARVEIFSVECSETL